MDTTEALLTLAVVTMTVGIPLMGLTLRYSLKPLVEAYVRVKEAHSGDRGDRIRALESRITMLERLALERGADVRYVEPAGRTHERA